MDTVWMAYIEDHKQNLKTIVGIYDSVDKAERALAIVLQRMGWRGSCYHPNVYLSKDRYEYGWKELPLNSFNVKDLWILCGVV